MADFFNKVKDKMSAVKDKLGEMIEKEEDTFLYRIKKRASEEA